MRVCEEEVVVVVNKSQRLSLTRAVEKGRMGKDGLGRLRTYREPLHRRGEEKWVERDRGEGKGKKEIG